MAVVTLLKYCHMSDPRITGMRIKQLRERRGWTMSELARRVGTRHGHISQIEAGSITAGHDVIARIAAALEVSVDYLIGQANIHDLQGDEQADDLIRQYAPNTPPNVARQVLNYLDRMSHEDRAYWVGVLARVTGDSEQIAE